MILQMFPVEEIFRTDYSLFMTSSSAENNFSIFKFFISQFFFLQVLIFIFKYANEIFSGIQSCSQGIVQFPNFSQGVEIDSRCLPFNTKKIFFNMSLEISKLLQRLTLERHSFKVLKGWRDNFSFVNPIKSFIRQFFLLLKVLFSLRFPLDTNCQRLTS